MNLPIIHYLLSPTQNSENKQATWKHSMLKHLKYCFLGYLFTVNSHACFSLIAGKQATASHTPLISRNSDSKDARRAKHLKIYTDASGLKLYLGLPYWDLVNDPTNDMAQVIMNRFGVVLSATETIQSNQTVLLLDPPSHSGQGVAEPNIPAIVMPHAKTAREAILLLGRAIESRGVNDDWGFGVQVADSNEAWYLETLSGHQWVAIRIPDDSYFVAANGPGQIQEYSPEKYDYLFSHYQDMSPMMFANQHGFAVYQNRRFNFKNSYGDVARTTNPKSNYVRVAYAQHLLNPSTHPFNATTFNKTDFPMFLKPEHPLTLDDVKRIQGSHYEDYPEYDPYVNSYEKPDARPFYYPIANIRTSNAHITQVFPSATTEDINIRSIEYIALGMPSLSFYLPIYYGISQVPTPLLGATNQADNSSLFWQFKKIQALVFLADETKQIPYEFQQRKQYVTAQYQRLEKQIQAQQVMLEADYHHRPNVDRINQFTTETVETLRQVNEQLIDHFMNELNLDARYELTTTAKKNAWFTRLVRQQDCFYRRVHCDGLMSPRLSTRDEKYNDE